MDDVIIHIEDISKRYKLGSIGSGSLQRDLQSFLARKRGKEDPNKRLGGKVYEKGEEFWALDHISIDILRGETIGIIGRNGAGKSTLLKLLSRVTAPTTGRICIKGTISSMLEVGTGFHGELTGRENVYLNGAILGMSREQINERFEAIANFSEIGTFMDTPVKRYSSGMYVKLAFAVAAHLNSDILIMDEVLAVGDAIFQKKCIEKMRELARIEHKTVLYVSHNMTTIEEMCERCMVLEKGCVKYIGDTQQAIKLYYEHEEMESAVSYQLSKRERPVGMECKVRMLHFQFMNKEIPVFKVSERVQGKLEWESQEELGAVCVRITIHYNGQAVASYVSEVMQIARMGGKYKNQISLDISRFVNGTYTASMGIYRREQEGIHTPCDYVRDAWSFEVVEGVIANQKWNHKYWGALCLPIEVY